MLQKSTKSHCYRRIILDRYLFTPRLIVYANPKLVKNKNYVRNKKNQVYGSLQNIGTPGAEVYHTDQ